MMQDMSTTTDLSPALLARWRERIKATTTVHVVRHSAWEYEVRVSGFEPVTVHTSSTAPNGDKLICWASDRDVLEAIEDTPGSPVVTAWGGEEHTMWASCHQFLRLP